MLCWISILGGLLIMMGQHDRSEALFYYFRLEDQVPETHLLRLIDKHISLAFVREKLKESYSDTGRISVDGLGQCTELDVAKFRLPLQKNCFDDSSEHEAIRFLTLRLFQFQGFLLEPPVDFLCKIVIATQLCHTEQWRIGVEDACCDSGGLRHRRQNKFHIAGQLRAFDDPRIVIAVFFIDSFVIRPKPHGYASAIQSGIVERHSTVKYGRTEELFPDCYPISLSTRTFKGGLRRVAMVSVGELTLKVCVTVVPRVVCLLNDGGPFVAVRQFISERGERHAAKGKGMCLACKPVNNPFGLALARSHLASEDQQGKRIYRTQSMSA